MQLPGVFSPMKSINFGVSLCLFLTVGHAHAATASWTPFTLIEATTDQVNGITFDRQESSNFAEAGQAPDLYAKGRAYFGELGGYAIATSQPFDYGAFAEVSWSDAFTITGDSGSGLLDIAVKVDGSFSGANTNVQYHLFTSDSPITRGSNGGSGLLGYQDGSNQMPPDGSTEVISGYGVGADTLATLSPEELALVEANPLNSGSNLYSVQVPFTYGVPLYIASYLGVEALGTGIADFYGTAHFGISAPQGAVLTTGSETVYQAANAVVPLPAAGWLFVSGLLGLRALRGRSENTLGVA